MSDDLRARAEALIEQYGLIDGDTIADLLAEVDRLTAERDMAWAHRDEAVDRALSYARTCYRLRTDEVAKGAEIERLRNLAAALEAELDEGADFATGHAIPW